MSQCNAINYKQIIQQQQKQLVAIQAQIQVLQAGAREGNGAQEANMEVARPQVFDKSSGKVLGFVTACKLYMRMKMRKVTVEEQIQWILSYI